MKEYVTAGKRDKDCDRQLSYDRDLGEGTIQAGCHGTGREDRVQDRVCLWTRRCH